MRNRTIESIKTIKPPRSLNSLRHGLHASTLAVPGLEDPADWIAFRDGVMEGLAPEGELESELARCVAECSWRKRRVARHEHQLITSERERESLRAEWDERRKHAVSASADPAVPQPQTIDESMSLFPLSPGVDMVAGLVIDRSVRDEVMLPSSKRLDQLMRYEAHLSRQIYHALHELQALQARRRGEPAPLARVSVLGGS